MRHWTDVLPRDACHPAIKWARTQPDAETAWQACARGDWMLWWLGRIAGAPGSDARRALVLCCCDVASIARRHTSGAARRAFDRCQRATRSWAHGRGATLDDVRAAAADAADAAYAAYAAYAAAYAAYAADAADAAYAADAADAADAAYAAYAADADARTRTLARCARIVRRHYPHSPVG